jgi:hypothetical protein
VVYPADGSGILKEANWPEAARPILSDFLFSEEGQSRGNATPRFIVAQNGKVVLTATGNAGWKDKVWPKIQEMAKASA